MSGRGPAIAALLLVAGCARTPGPVHEDRPEASGPEEVRLSEQSVRAAGIRSVTVSREAFHPHILASGVVRPVAMKSAKVRALVAGRVARVLADVGDRVQTGQALAAIEGSEVTAALARHQTAVSRERAARRSLQRAEALLEMKAISGAEVEVRRADAEAAAAEAGAAGQELIRLGLDLGEPARGPEGLAEIPVRAPISGVVLERTVSPGLLVQREAPLFEVADLSSVWVVLDVYQKDLGQIQDRGEVEIHTEAYPGEIFRGRIALVEPTLDEASRTAHVRVVLGNPSGRLRPGMFVSAAMPLRGASETPAVALPEDAVQTFSGLSAVFVEKEPGLYFLRPVETGRVDRGMVEIKSGLAVGDRVVASGAFLLKSELLKRSIGGDDH